MVVIETFNQNEITLLHLLPNESTMPNLINDRLVPTETKIHIHDITLKWLPGLGFAFCELHPVWNMTIDSHPATQDSLPQWFRGLFPRTDHSDPDVSTGNTLNRLLRILRGCGTDIILVNYCNNVIRWNRTRNLHSGINWHTRLILRYVTASVTMSRGKYNLVMLIIRLLTQRETSNTGFIFTVRN